MIINMVEKPLCLTVQSKHDHLLHELETSDTSSVGLVIR